jgi:hypothetical protein
LLFIRGNLIESGEEACIIPICVCDYLCNLPYQSKFFIAF